MEYDETKGVIKLDRELSELDKFVMDFVRLLDSYVIVSGYVSILFGRSRATEDVDLLIPKLEKNEFIELFSRINDGGFECLNTSDVEEAFDMLNEFAIRFARKGQAVPNMEFKMAKSDIDKYSFENRLKVFVEGGEFYISPLEIQIAFKLTLGSDKDLEDTKHIYELFKEQLDNQELDRLIEKMQVREVFERIK